MAAAGNESTRPVLDVGVRTKPVELDFFCGVRCYVALPCRASYADASTRGRGYIIPTETLAQGSLVWRDRQTLPNRFSAV
jgi:hypothetical protein